jgi:dihydrofolate reductase
MISPRFACVVAADLDDGIGKDNDLPWPRLPTDLRTFKRITSAAAPGRTNALVMGRLTWESIPPALRPLPGRRERGGVARPTPRCRTACGWRARSTRRCVSAARTPSSSKLFVIGGGQIYAQAFAHPGVRRDRLDPAAARFACDTLIPPVPAGLRARRGAGRGGRGGRHAPTRSSAGGAAA